MPNFGYEKEIWNKGYKLIAGVDEVGRGCFAGPVAAGCVIFNKQIGHSVISKYANEGIIINDSKKMSAKQRGVADRWIRKNAAGYGVGSASVFQINKFGIKKATEIAFRKAIVNCLPSAGGKLKIDHLLIDAFYIPYVKGLRRKNQLAIVKGDTKSISIAAASIVAKVYRDKLMTALAKDKGYKKYKWHKNKGYGTKEHRQAIKRYGITKLHRKKFVQTYQEKIGLLGSRVSDLS